MYARFSLWLFGKVLLPIRWLINHGSAKQDPELVRSLAARQAIISVGQGNDYGHPKASTLALLRQAGVQVHRTDTEGAVAVVVGPAGELSVVGQR